MISQRLKGNIIRSSLHHHRSLCHLTIKKHHRVHLSPIHERSWFRSSSTSSTISPPASGFPGAPNSSFTQELQFQRNWPIISTFRVLDTEGAVMNGAAEPEISDQVLIKMYKSMMTLNVRFDWSLHMAVTAKAI